MIHLSKFGQLGKDPNKDSDSDLEQSGDTSKKWIEESFFCYGYYDKMTYIAENPQFKQVYFTCDHAFSIHYPYQDAKQPINADQLFVLLEPLEEVSQEENPFTNHEQKKPFLGIFLINISDLNQRADNEFWPVLVRMRNCLKDNLKNVGAKVFFSPNCADLCVVFRTDKLEEIYKTRNKLSEYMITEESQNKPAINTILYIASEPSEQSPTLSSNELIRKNKKHKIEIRMHCSEKIACELQNEMGKTATLVGATGKGEYILELPYEDFAAIYPIYTKINWSTYIPPEESEQKYSSPLAAFFSTHYTEIRFFYERWHIHLANNPANGAQDYTYAWEKRKAICAAMENSVKAMKNLSVQLAADEDKITYFPVQRFMEQYQQIKDLLYTYNNLWYNDNTVSEGCIFYAQMAVLTEAVSQQLKIIKRIQDMLNDPQNCRQVISPQTISMLNDDLIRNMNIMISGINDFNKLIQAVNQNLINVPNYEMHSKVNVEKYLYAYTMYLMEVCSKYYTEYKKDEKHTERIFPMVTISQVTQNITAPMLFQSFEDSEDSSKGVRVFLVRCPNYQRFANVYHVLPMITHEISHCFRYTDRKSRNEFILQYLSQAMAETITYRLFELNYEKYYAFQKGNALKFIYNIIRDKLAVGMKDMLEDQLPHLHLINMPKICITTMRRVFNTPSFNDLSNKIVWESTKKNLLELFKLCHITYVTPEDIKTKWGQCKRDAMPNLLIDILKKDRSRVEQWHETLSNEELKAEFNKDQYLQRLGETVEKYLLHGELSIQSITYGLEAVSKRMWKGFLTGNHRCISELQKNPAETISERIMKCTDESPIFLDCEIEELKEELDLDREEVFRLRKYIMETAGLIREILGKWMTTLTDQKITISDDTQKSYIQMMHDSLHERYVEAASHPNENEWIFTQKSQRLMVSLGIVNKDPEQFETALEGAVNAIDEQQFERIMQDKMMLYGEVFADLGMCKVLGFTPFGYLAYTIHLHMKESEMPKGIATNMLTERLKWVMYILRKSDNPDFSDWSDLEAQLGEYEQRINSCDESKETRMHQRMLKWMKHIYADMHLDYFPEETKMFSEHLQEMYAKPSMKALQDVRNPLLEEIGEYYNKFIENVNNPNAARRTMDIQNNFVLQYYGKMQDASARIKRWELSNLPQEDDFAVLYNRVFMQWDMEEMV